ncbi:MAG: tetratricopeptide repeat protein [Pirellulales bacterium]
MPTVAEVLQQGAHHQQVGQWADAERCYRHALAVEPDHPHALHLLGTLALECGQYETAAALIEQAVRADCSQAAYYANLGEAYRRLDKPQEAIANYQTALRLQPGLVHAQTMLGTLLQAAGDLDRAATAFRDALKLQPENLRARARLGQVLLEQNKPADAEACFRRVLRGEPTSPAAHFELGSVLQAQGRLDEAAACYRAAIELEPKHAEAHTNLGTILQGRQEYEAADAQFQAALRADPNRAVAHLNLGTNYQACGRLDEAEACYRAAIALEPANADLHVALGSAAQSQGKMDEALAAFREAIRLRPTDAAGHLHAASALAAQGKLEDALGDIDEVLRLEPDNADAYSNLGMIRNEQGRRDEAIAACRQAVEQRPDFADPHNNIAVALMALGQMKEAIAEARLACQYSPAGSPHFSNLLYMLNYDPSYSPAAIFAEHRAWGSAQADPLTATAAPHTNDRAPNRRLRIGYLSAHFCAHAVNFFSEPILAAHDHQQFEVVCYSHVDHPDETTRRLQGYADQWREIKHLSDQQTSELVRADQIDILIDLSGHIGGNRLLVFARKPAPVQVTYIGYQNTTGMAAMDYRLTDAWADPPGTTDAHYTEKLVRLPRAFFCYLPSAAAPEVSPLPTAQRGYVTFGSFNAFSKITPEVLATWARLLTAVPNSRLIILGNVTPSLAEHLTQSFASRGIDTARITLADRRPRLDYLRLIASADIALDPFPFNGHTTTCDALWQGVPVVTLAGETYVQRFGSSAHINLGLEDLIARTEDEYVDIAARLAGNLPRLTALRAGLRERMARSPIVDAVGFTRNLEAAYRTMWIDWCRRPAKDETSV